MPLLYTSFAQTLLIHPCARGARAAAWRVSKAKISLARLTCYYGDMEQYESLTEFLKKFPVRTFGKGEIVVAEGLHPRKCYVVKSGFAKVFLTTKSGEEKDVRFIASNDIFPLSWTFGRTETSLYYYQAYTDCEMYEIPREELTRYVETEPTMYRRMFEYMLEVNIDLIQHIHSLEQAKASDKILYAFNFLTRRFGKQISGAHSRMLLPLTQQDLANFLGLTRETTGAQLKELQAKGIIKYQQQQYVIHTDRLRALIEG